MKKRSAKPKETILQIKFANEAAAEHFAHWLCGSGEQQYWDWMEYREEDEDGDITATHFHFHYHGEEDETKAQTDPKRYGEFMCDNIIRTTCSRLDKDE